MPLQGKGGSQLNNWITDEAVAKAVPMVADTFTLKMPYIGSKCCKRRIYTSLMCFVPQCISHNELVSIILVHRCHKKQQI